MKVNKSFWVSLADYRLVRRMCVDLHKGGEDEADTTAGKLLIINCNFHAVRLLERDLAAEGKEAVDAWVVDSQWLAEDGLAELLAIDYINQPGQNVKAGECNVVLRYLVKPGGVETHPNWMPTE